MLSKLKEPQDTDQALVNFMVLSKLKEPQDTDQALVNFVVLKVHQIILQEEWQKLLVVHDVESCICFQIL
jgi:hypothetical protein